jgi:hypothetical protein
MSSVGKTTKGIRKLDPLKHPRDSKGRFIETPDQPKKPGATRAQGRQLARAVQELKQAVEIARQRQEVRKPTKRESLIASLTPTQRQRFIDALVARREAGKPKAESKPKTSRTIKPADTSSVPTDISRREKFTKNTDKKILKKYAREGNLSLLDRSELTHINQIKAPTPRVHPADIVKLNTDQV